MDDGRRSAPGAWDAGRLQVVRGNSGCPPGPVRDVLALAIDLRVLHEFPSKGRKVHDHPTGTGQLSLERFLVGEEVQLLESARFLELFVDERAPLLHRLGIELAKELERDPVSAEAVGGPKDRWFTTSSTC